MQLINCTRCENPFPPAGLLDGVCHACLRPPETEEDRRAKRIQAAVDQANMTRAERAVLANGLGLGPEPEPKPRAKPRPSTGSALFDEIAEKTEQQRLVEQELARRALSRRKLLPFVLRFNEGYSAGWVHKIICEELERFEQDVVARKSPRLIIQMPPRHGKSELVSRMFPSWFLGRNPQMEVIAASHTTNLSMDFSRKVRGIFRSDSFGTVFKDAVLSDDSQAAEHWRTTRGGGYTAVGVGSAVVGKGAHVLIIDDPVAGEEDAESFKAREAVKGWYQTEAYTRLAPGGGVLIIMQRWHDEDLVGWLLSREEKADASDRENWRVISFPAEATEDEPHRKQGEALHPERYPLHLLHKIRANMTPRQWEALYQQNPVPDTGSYFLKEFFSFYDPEELPALDTLNVYSTWDLAIGQNEQNDWTVGYTAGLSRNGNLYILDRQRGRWPAHDLTEKLLDVQKMHNVQILGLEKGHIQMTLGPFLSKRMAERRQMGFLLHPLAVGRRDKQARARSIQGRMQQGKVFWPKKAPWLADAMRELMRFPNGTHDDDADAIGHMGLLLDEMVPTREAAVAPAKGWVDRLKNLKSSTTRSAMSA